MIHVYMPYNPYETGDEACRQINRYVTETVQSIEVYPQGPVVPLAIDYDGLAYYSVLDPGQWYQVPLTRPVFSDASTVTYFFDLDQGYQTQGLYARICSLSLECMDPHVDVYNLSDESVRVYYNVPVGRVYDTDY